MFKHSATLKSNSWRALLKIPRSRICSIRCFNSRWWELKSMNRLPKFQSNNLMEPKVKGSLILMRRYTKSRLLLMPKLLNSNSRHSKSWPLRFKRKFKNRSPTSKRLLKWCRYSKVSQMMRLRPSRCSNTLTTSRFSGKISWIFSSMCLSNKLSSNNSRKLAF